MPQDIDRPPTNLSRPEMTGVAIANLYADPADRKHRKNLRVPGRTHKGDGFFKLLRDERHDIAKRDASEMGDPVDYNRHFYTPLIDDGV
jgi:hypothetical protein